MINSLFFFKGSLYAIGGNDGSVSLETCEMYNPRENKWTMIEQMNKRRAGAGATELNGFIFVAGDMSASPNFYHL